MESALDVLSRAATMVETDRQDRTTITNNLSDDIRRNDDLRPQATRVLPSRIYRVRRSTERRELAQVLRFDQSHNTGTRPPFGDMMDTDDEVVTRCAGTQTEITLRLHDNDVNIPEVSPALPTASTSHLAPTPIHLPDGRASHQVRLSHQVRPSVITCAPCQPRELDHAKDTMMKSNLGPLPISCQKNEASIGICDPVIEEHFRRSLGKDYQESVARSSSKPTDGMVTMITGSVDDHFAKALGDKWPLIKNVMKPNGQRSPPASPHTLHAALLT